MPARVCLPQRARVDWRNPRLRVCTDYRTIRTVHTIVKRQLSLNDMYHLLELQSANGLVVSFDHSNVGGDVEAGGLSTWLKAGANVFKQQQVQRAQSPLVLKLFPDGTPFSFMGDGSNDRSLVEQEAVVLRFLGGDGRAYNTFFDLATLDLTQSADGLSPDAACIAACYAKSLDALDENKGFLFGSAWRSAAVGVSFDGASVMLGAQNGVAKKIADMTDTHLSVIHAVAHVQQLSNADAFADIDYYPGWRETVQEVYKHYSFSGKKRFSLEAVATELGDKLLKIGGVHGIRWAASLARTLKSLMTDLPAVVVDLERTVKNDLGLEYTQLTPSSAFVKKTFTHVFAHESTGRRTPYRALVKCVVPNPNGVTANDRFIIVYRNNSTLEMSKAELIAKLTNLEDERLKEDPRWQLRDKLTDWRFCAFTAVMLDVHEQLAILSKSYQSNSLVVFDISRNLNKTLRSLKKIKDIKGPEETSFLAACAEDDDAQCLRTCQLYQVEAGTSAFKADREALIDSLSNHLIERFQKVLDDPVLKAMAAFDHRMWPSEDKLLEKACIDEIELLYSTYSSFFKAETETKTLVLEQWSDMKSMISSEAGLKSRKFHDLWSHMLVHFCDEYKLVLRLVSIALLIPCDTSECERVFSLMNDLKTAERNRLGQANLTHLMIWHLCSKDRSCAELDVRPILDEFVRLAGPQGRKTHRGTKPPEYTYSVGK